MLVAVGAVAVTGLVAYFFFGRKRRSPPVTLVNPDVKHSLPLIEKEVVLSLIRINFPSRSSFCDSAVVF